MEKTRYYIVMPDTLHHVNSLDEAIEYIKKHGQPEKIYSVHDNVTGETAGVWDFKGVDCRAEWERESEVIRIEMTLHDFLPNLLFDIEIYGETIYVGWIGAPFDLFDGTNSTAEEMRGMRAEHYISLFKTAVNYKETAKLLRKIKGYCGDDTVITIGTAYEPIFKYKGDATNE